MSANADPPPPDEVVAAFERLSQRTALLEAAVGGFAARQEMIAARDHGPDIAKILARQERIWAEIHELKSQPAMKLTPQMVAAQIDEAASSGRHADHMALKAATDVINDMVARSRTLHEQEARVTRAYVWGMATVAGIVLVGLLGVEWIG